MMDEGFALWLCKGRLCIAAHADGVLQQITWSCAPAGGAEMMVSG
jgi:hypothetical protein